MNKQIIWTTGSPLVYLIVGIVLLAVSQSALRPICYMMALIAAVVGVVQVIGYIRKPVNQTAGKNGFTTGTLLLLVSVSIFANASKLISAIPFILALFIALNGIHELQNTIDVHRLHVPRAWVTALIAILHMLLGIVLLVNPFSTQTAFLTVLGIGLVASGLTDFMVDRILATKMKSLQKDQSLEKLQQTKNSENSRENTEDRPL